MSDSGEHHLNRKALKACTLSEPHFSLLFPSISSSFSLSECLLLCLFVQMTSPHHAPTVSLISACTLARASWETRRANHHLYSTGQLKLAALKRHIPLYNGSIGAGEFVYACQTPSPSAVSHPIWIKGEKILCWGKVTDTRLHFKTPRPLWQTVCWAEWRVGVYW